MKTIYYCHYYCVQVEIIKKIIKSENIKQERGVGGSHYCRLTHYGGATSKDNKKGLVFNNILVLC
jgi:hypothetical protein